MIPVSLFDQRLLAEQCSVTPVIPATGRRVAEGAGLGEKDNVGFRGDAAAPGLVARYAVLLGNRTTAPGQK
jgi:hypothetical protein